MNRRSWLSLLVICAAASLLQAQPQNTTEHVAGKVIAVTDGDTLTLLRPDKSKLTIRLEGIDAPESKQQHGEKAKDALAFLTLNKEATIRKTGEDRYGRTLGVVMVDGKDVNLAMVASGWAWHFKKYNKDQELAAAEEKARGSKAGLWAGENIIAPWEYRSRQKVGEVPANGRRWLNISTGVRHNERCQSFNNTKRGRFCEPDEGKPCGICGG